jgi:hypothetical protein
LVVVPSADPRIARLPKGYGATIAQGGRSDQKTSKILLQRHEGHKEVKQGGEFLNAEGGNRDRYEIDGFAVIRNSWTLCLCGEFYSFRA